MYWLLVGSPEHWKRALERRLWGVSEKRKNLWERVSEGDGLIFYATRPVGGIIGIGQVVNKFEGKEPLWPDEIKEGRVIWRYRIGFEVIYSLPRQEWEKKKIPIDGLKITTRAGLSRIREEEKVKKLLEEMKSRWEGFPREVQLPVSAPAMEEEKSRLHDEIAEKIKEIGEMEGFIGEREFKIDDQRLDVIWRDDPDGAPKYVFEVVVHGDLNSCLVKFQHAYKKWGYPKLFLVVSKENKRKAENLINKPFHGLKDKVKVVTLEEIDELYTLERKIKEVKSKLGIP